MRVAVVVTVEVENEAEADTWMGAVLDRIRPDCAVCNGKRVIRGISRGVGRYDPWEDEDPPVCPLCKGEGKFGEHPYAPKIVKVAEVKKREGEG